MRLRLAPSRRLTQLMRGIDNTRSKTSRLCIDTARHLSTVGRASSRPTL